MTEEEKETISILEDLAEHGLCYTVTEDIQGKLKIILNLIQRKDRQIDLMARHIEKGCDFDSRIQTKEQIKQYFAEQAKEV